MEKLKETLSKLSGRTALWWSGGADSTLLMFVMLELNLDFDLIRFDDFLTRSQKQYSDDLITSLNLKVFSYPAKEVYFIGKGRELSAVFELPMADGLTVPLIRDCVKGSRCIADLDTPKVSHAPIFWETQIVGSRKDDKHYAFDGIQSELWQVGKTLFFAPLFDWSREKVERKLKQFHHLPPKDEFLNTGNIRLCTNCLKDCKTTYCPLEKKRIPTVKWDRETMLSTFKEKYQF